MIVNVVSFLGFNSARRVGYAHHVGHSPTQFGSGSSGLGNANLSRSCLVEGSGRTVNVKLAQRFVCLLARLRERIEVRETGMASFIIMSSCSPCPLEVRPNQWG